MKDKAVRILGPLFGLLLFAFALWVLHHELRAYRYEEIAARLREIPAGRLLLALGLTIAGYLVLTWNDTLAFRYIRSPIAFRKIGPASFISYAFSNNIGLSLITGSTVRYRLYSVWGLSAVNITKVIAFCTLTFWLGLFTMGGLAFLLEPMSIPSSLHFSLITARPFGIFLLMVVAAYLLSTFLLKKPLKVREWEFSLPSPGLSIAQIGIASLDWALAGAVLYVLLPSTGEVSYFSFLGIFLLAQIAGLISQVPGGLGVFETIILVLLPHDLPASAIAGSLLVYRGIYYLIPLILAAVLLGAHELFERKEGMKRSAKVFGQWIPGLVPRVLAFTVFVGGAILLFSGATPAITSRMEWLKRFLPLPLIATSHFLGSLVGITLLLLARGLQRRLDTAYHFTVILLAAGIFFSLLKGLDYEEAAVLTLMLGALLPCHRYFYREASLMKERFAPASVAAITVILLGSLWLGIFSTKHVEYLDQPWWRFILSDQIPLSLRATVVAVAVSLFFGLANLLRPAQPDPAFPSAIDLARAAPIVEGSGHTSANLAFLGDKALLFSENKTAFMMYAIQGRSWVALGDPVGPEKETAELVWQFQEMVDIHDGRAVFYDVQETNLPLYLDLGLTQFKLGEEAVVPLVSFSLEGGIRKGLRNLRHRLMNEGCTFEVINPERTLSLFPEMKEISDVWLKEKNTREKKFSIGFFDVDYLKRFPIGIVRKEEKIVAFANLWLGANKEELSIDLMRYLPEAPPDVMAFLLIELMLWGKGAEYQWFNLGMAPLSGLEDRMLAPFWSRIGTFIYHHSEHFYHFEGLREYKSKFHPEWRPKYLVSPGGLSLPRILSDIATLIAGGLKGIITK
jgi:phosphatidylglycerol lysyltransferase